MAKKQLTHDDPDDKGGGRSHPSIDSTGRFAVDALIRSIKINDTQVWRIWRRKSGMEPVWEHVFTGEKKKQSDLLKTLANGRVEDARMVEDMYLDDKYGLKRKGEAA